MEGMAIGALMFSGALALYAAYVMRKANEHVREANKSLVMWREHFADLWGRYTRLLEESASQPARAPNGRFVKRGQS